MLAFTVDWYWSLAERAYRQALELDPADVIAHVSYAQFLAVTGRTRKSTAHCVQAEELDPLSVIVKCVAGFIYDWNGASEPAERPTPEIFWQSCRPARRAAACRL